jgi:divinyl protochlorophyllide a 8-vinyl-reductase
MCPASSTEARIGPNAVIQLGEALAAHGAGRLAREIFLAAGHPEWLDCPPDVMLPEVEVAALHAALHRLLPEDEARAYAREAGMRTGDYILAHRIPRPARLTLRLLPSGLAARLLLEAVAAHAWTFAGSGPFAFTTGERVTISIAANPLATAPGCDWHAAVFSRLFQSLVHETATVQETACCARGDPACVFRVSWAGAEGRAAPRLALV